MIHLSLRIMVLLGSTAEWLQFTSANSSNIARVKRRNSVLNFLTSRIFIPAAVNVLQSRIDRRFR